MSNITCNGCTACCRGFQAIMLHPDEGDIVDDYDTIPFMQHPGAGGADFPDGIFPDHFRDAVILKHKENGDCIYLGEKGCTIYDKRPVICKSYDCRINYMMWTKARRQSSNQNPEVWQAGKERLHTLSGNERLKAIAARKAGVS